MMGQYRQRRVNLLKQIRDGEVRVPCPVCGLVAERWTSVIVTSDHPTPGRIWNEYRAEPCGHQMSVADREELVARLLADEGIIDDEDPARLIEEITHLDGEDARAALRHIARATTGQYREARSAQGLVREGLDNRDAEFPPA